MRIKQLALAMLIALTVTAPQATLAKSSAAKPDSVASKTEAKAKPAEEKAKATAETKKPEETGKATDKKPADKKAAEKKPSAEAAKPADKEHEGMIFVKGYTKKDGTKVEGYWRKKGK